jgi:carbamoyl-phosphate synthase small subunit
MSMVEALLVLEDGTAFEGRSFGAQGERAGEVVFNTGMTGYQEILTDPSYRGQMVVMTYPHIGNTGINAEDPESAHPHLRALIVREVSRQESNWRARQTLARYLKDHEIMALTDVDTRALTRHIRQFGALRGAISTIDLDPASLQRKALAAPTTSEQDLVAQVSCTAPYEWTEPVAEEWQIANEGNQQMGEIGKWGKSANGGNRQTTFNVQPLPLPHVVAYDCGIKRNILRQLVASGCRVTVVPASTSVADVLALGPDCVFLSNGPGDPENVPYLLSNVRSLLGRVPIFGICLGHQILALALGARTYKLKFGHHGSNHPVRNLRTGQIAITAQNHNFAVDVDSLPDDVELTHVNLYDHTVEGLCHRRLSMFSVQYHPEAAPGPHDANPLFGEFVRMIRNDYAPANGHPHDPGHRFRPHRHRPGVRV